MLKKAKKCQPAAKASLSPAPKKKRRWGRISLLILLCLLVAGSASVAGINAYVQHSGGAYIRTPEQAAGMEADCILVLGCYVHDSGAPSDMLRDRLTRGVWLYEQKAAPKLLMSGDHGRTDYDEVNAMKQYAMEAGVPSEAIFMDHAGFSTYESLYRAKEIFGARKIVIVTQQYHLYRALYIARQLGLDAVGVSADYTPYVGQAKREAREVLARCKDFMTSIFKPKPTFLGDPIPVSGNGNVTND